MISAGGVFIHSAAATWDHLDDVYYYRCGDKQMYDLVLVVPDGYEFDTVAYTGVERINEDRLTTQHPRAMRHVIARTRAMMCNRLRRLLLGTDVREVLEYIHRGLFI